MLIQTTTDTRPLPIPHTGLTMREHTYKNICIITLERNHMPPPRSHSKKASVYSVPSVFITVTPALSALKTPRPLTGFVRK